MNESFRYIFSARAPQLTIFILQVSEFTLTNDLSMNCEEFRSAAKAASDMLIDSLVLCELALSEDLLRAFIESLPSRHKVSVLKPVAKRKLNIKSSNLIVIFSGTPKGEDTLFNIWLLLRKTNFVAGVSLH